MIRSFASAKIDALQSGNLSLRQGKKFFILRGQFEGNATNGAVVNRETVAREMSTEYEVSALILVNLLH